MGKVKHGNPYPPIEEIEAQRGTQRCEVLREGQITDRIVGITFETMERVQRLAGEDNDIGDALALYLFYTHVTRVRFNTEIRCNSKYITKGLGWSKERIRKTKKFLISIGLVEDFDIRGKDGQIDVHMVKVRYAVVVKSHVMENQPLDNQQVGKPAAGFPPLNTAIPTTNNAVPPNKQGSTYEQTNAVRGATGSLGVDNEAQNPPQAPSPQKAAKSPTKRAPFIPPDWKQVAAYCREMKYWQVNPDHFIKYYAPRNWTDRAGAPVVSWKLKLKTWQEQSLAKKEDPWWYGMSITYACPQPRDQSDLNWNAMDYQAWDFWKREHYREKEERGEPVNWNWVEARF